jgi:glycolate oxidase iron-sulfur subunit
VRYDLLIERARAARRVEVPVPPRGRAVDRLAFGVFMRPKLLRALSLPLAAGIRPTPLAPRVSLSDLRAAPPRYTPARGARKQSAALLEGCVQQVYFGKVNAAAVTSLAADGCEVCVPNGQGCCGALALHAGREDEAKRRAQETVETFKDFDRVVVTAAGCGSAMKGYGELLGTPEAEKFSAAVRDVTELLDELGPRAERAPRPATRVVYQDACHLNHGQGVSDPPRNLLKSIPGIELIDIDRPGMCCGSAGLYNLTQPDTARELGLRKARSILDAAPDIIATANPGCALQLSASLRKLKRGDIPIVHPVELLADSVS